MKKTIFILFLTLVTVFAVNSCTKYSYTTDYQCGFSVFNAQVLGEMTKVTEYITSNNGLFGTVFIEKVKSISSNDKEMKQKFESAASKLDFSTLNLDENTQFEYSATRTDESGKMTVISSMKWPK